MKKLIKQSLVLEDPWTKIEENHDNNTHYPWFSLVPLETLVLRDQWPLPQAWIGAWFESNVNPDLFSKNILDLPVLSIEVADYQDGRCFSLAKILKTKLNFQGDLRISGNFLLDQIAMLKACGVDSFLLPDGSDHEHALFILKNSPCSLFRDDALL